MSGYIGMEKLKSEVRKKKAKKVLKKIGRGIMTTGKGIKKGYQKTEKIRGQFTREILPRLTGAGREISGYAEQYEKSGLGLRQPKKKKEGFGYLIGSQSTTKTLREVPILRKRKSQSMLSGMSLPKKKKGKGSFNIF